MTARAGALTDGFETVVGLEVHVQLLTARKLFSPAAVRVDARPNTQLDAVDVGLPGALPVLNREAVRLAIRLGLALNAHIAARSQFARKHYFYPDSPKGYQTSQADEPVIGAGHLTVVIDDKSGDTLDVPVARAHLEEDAGKSVHDGDATRLDFNRAGTALLEVVTAPALRSGDEAMRFFRALRAAVVAAGICDGNLQEGSMRADANVSVRRPGEPLGTRVELKNINSPRFLHDAVEHEAARQRGLLRRGERVVQETRLWDADQHASRTMRSKEDAPDYRYLPDPDLPPLLIDAGEIERERSLLPELPEPRRRRLIDVVHLPPPTAALIAADADLARTFDEATTAAGGHGPAIAKWLTNDVAAARADGGGDVFAAALARLVVLVETGEVAGKDAKTIVRHLVRGAADLDVTDAAGVDALVSARGLRLQRGEDAQAALRAIVTAVFAEHPEQVAQVRAGKDKVKGFLVGQVLKRAAAGARGGADPKLAQALVDDALAGGG